MSHKLGKIERNDRRNPKKFRNVADNGIYLLTKELYFVIIIGRCNRSFFKQTNMEVNSVVRVKITLACTECKQRNYDTTKEKRNHPDRMETKKYCRFCRRHTLHKETK